MNETDLIIKAKQGDKDAFCELYGLYKDRLYRYAFYRLGNADDAEDAVSDCIINAFVGICKLKNPEAFSAWIFRILYASCVTQIKEQEKRRKNESLDFAYNKVFDNSMENSIKRTELQNALNILKDDEKEIVLLSVVSGFNSKEIATITGFTPGAVRSKLSRSLKKMKDFLE